MVLVGTCGYHDYRPGENWKERYKSKLHAYSACYDVCELNRTFYELPKVETAQRWREEVEAGFAFTVKAWQASTHPVKGVTWRKRREKLTEAQKAGFGHLRPNDEVFEAWNQTLRVAHALQSRVCLLQTPPSFDCTDEHEQNMRTFLGGIERDSVEIAWEPRGNGNDALDRVERLCRELGLMHVVDPLRRAPRSTQSACYLRLHRLNPKESDYNYSYSEDELKRLADSVGELQSRYSTVYCLFNNIAMHTDAPRRLSLRDLRYTFQCRYQLRGRDRERRIALPGLASRPGSVAQPTNRE